MSHRAISVPVRPSPARQCTASAPSVDSATLKKRSTMASQGVEQSTKKRSWCLNPACQVYMDHLGLNRSHVLNGQDTCRMPTLMTDCRSYSALLRRTIAVIPFAAKTSK